MKKNKFLEEVQKFRFNNVTVTSRKDFYEGRFEAIDFKDKSIILMTDKEKILITPYFTITRKRSFDKVVKRG